ncbi:hypothetical protein Ancab_012953 [Ancistrocladus abbreviatus]
MIIRKEINNGARQQDRRPRHCKLQKRQPWLGQKEFMPPSWGKKREIRVAGKRNLPSAKFSVGDVPRGAEESWSPEREDVRDSTFPPTGGLSLLTLYGLLHLIS